MIACRTCLGAVNLDAEHFTVNMDGTTLDPTPLKDKLQYCIPEMQFDTFCNEVICKPCHYQFTNFYKFKANCLKIEAKINKFCKDVQIVNLDISRTELCQITQNNANAGEELALIDVQELIAHAEAQEEDNYLGPYLDENILQEAVSPILDVAALSPKPIPSPYLEEHISKEPLSRIIDVATHFPEPILGRRVSNKHYSCTQCRYTCDKINLFKIHMQTHVKRKKVLGSICVKTGDEKPYHCSLCPYRSNRLDVIKAHMGRHAGERPYKCKHCDYASSTNSNLHIHVRRRHSADKPHKCGNCPAAFASKNLLAVHEQTHTGVYAYKCGECVFSSNYKATLVKHMIYHTVLEWFNCETCGYKARSANALSVHKRTHRYRKNLNCDLCRFVGTSLELKRHMDVHATKCDQCEFKSARAAVLEHHRKFHLHGNPYRCGACNSSFCDIIELTKHVRSHNK